MSLYVFKPWVCVSFLKYQEWGNWVIESYLAVIILFSMHAPEGIGINQSVWLYFWGYFEYASDSFDQFS